MFSNPNVIESDFDEYCFSSLFMLANIKLGISNQKTGDENMWKLQNLFVDIDTQKIVCKLHFNAWSRSSKYLILFLPSLEHIGT